MKKTSTVQLVRNATLKIRYAGHTMLIDPVLADKGTLISALGVNKTPRVHLTIPIQDIIGGVDMVLLTHNHIDHYEPSKKGLSVSSVFIRAMSSADRVKSNMSRFCFMRSGFTDLGIIMHTDIYRARTGVRCGR